jgi:hypothetical protein
MRIGVRTKIVPPTREKVYIHRDKLVGIGSKIYAHLKRKTIPLAGEKKGIKIEGGKEGDHDPVETASILRFP